MKSATSRQGWTYTFTETPVGRLLLVRDNCGLKLLEFYESNRGRIESHWTAAEARFRDVIVQLSEYFQGKRRMFELPLAPEGTSFQQGVWRRTLLIPYGATLSYGNLARELGRPAAYRAVGAANGRNPLPIIIPCHRVIGSSGALVGYGGGLHIKEALLALERNNLLQVPQRDR